MTYNKNIVCPLPKKTKKKHSMVVVFKRWLQSIFLEQDDEFSLNDLYIVCISIILHIQKYVSCGNLLRLRIKVAVFTLQTNVYSR